MVGHVWSDGGGHTWRVVCAGLVEQGVYYQSGHCGDWIFFVGNGEDRFGVGDVVRRTEAGPGFELARHVGGAGGDDEGGLVGALA